MHLSVRLKNMYEEILNSCMWKYYHHQYELYGNDEIISFLIRDFELKPRREKGKKILGLFEME